MIVGIIKEVSMLHLIHWGPVTPYGVIGICMYWSRYNID